MDKQRQGRWIKNENDGRGEGGRKRWKNGRENGETEKQKKRCRECKKSSFKVKTIIVTIIKIEKRIILK